MGFKLAGFATWAPTALTSLSSTTAAAKAGSETLGRCAFMSQPLRVGPYVRRAVSPAFVMRPMRMGIEDFGVPEGATAGIENLPLEPIPAGDERLPVEWSKPGVYGVYNASGDLMYIAAVEDVAEAIDVHRRIIGDPLLLHWVRTITVENENDAPLGTLAQNWLVAHTKDTGAPIGNTAEGADWRVRDAAKGGDVYFRPGIAAEQAELEIKRILRTYKVVLFMKGTRDAPRCGFSNRTVSVLKTKVNEIDLACVDCLDERRNSGLRSEIKRYSDWPTIPQLYINGDFVGGADIVDSLDQTGELTALLESAGVDVKATRPRAAA